MCDLTMHDLRACTYPGREPTVEGRRLGDSNAMPPPERVTARVAQTVLHSEGDEGSSHHKIDLLHSMQHGRVRVASIRNSSNCANSVHECTKSRPTRLLSEIKRWYQNRATNSRHLCAEQ